jgi:pilus assembly protein CpaB
MNMTRILILVAALGAAGVAAFLARGLMGGQNNAAAQTNMDMTEILVAAKAIEVGSKINPGDLKWQGWPKAAVDPTFVAKHTAGGALDEMTEGSVARVPLANGEPVTSQKIIKSDGAGFLAAVLTPGKRAVGVKLTTDRGAGGFILPNDRVDVIMTRKLGNNEAGVPAYRAATVLRDVRVLAVDQTAQEEGESKSIVAKTATLELSAQQAEILALAEAMGDLSLSLRSLSQGDGAAQDDNASAKGLGGDDENRVSVLRFGIPSQTAPNAKE